MGRHVLQILFVFIIILALIRCAQIVPLSGGTRDTTPPKLMEALPKLNSTNFKDEIITLKFDEFVQVKDLSNQLIVTPRLNSSPEISADGKKIIIKLKKNELEPNTTYRLYFGKAIADMNESNPIQNFEYVFSTGNHIDSLTVTGEISNAFNNKPEPNALIAVYFQEKANDSLPYIKEPDYLTRSDETGNFSLKNLPYKSFRVYAFTDKNKNYLYDGEIEKIAFLSSDLKLLSDTSIQLKMFQEEASKSFVKKTTVPYFGFAQILLNKKTNVRLTALDSSQQPNIFETHSNSQKDTISLYYKNISDTLNLALYNYSNNKTDTLRLILPKPKAGKSRLKSFTTNTVGGKLLLYDKLKLQFLNWMDTSKVDMSKMKFSSKEDSLIAEQPVTGRWKSVTTFEIDHNLKEGVTYTLKVDTNAFFDWNHFTNDSSIIKVTPQSKIEFGKVTLKCLFYKKQSYVVQLLNEQDQVVKEQNVSLSLSSSNAVSIEFIDVPPAIYRTKIIFDDNENKKWDSGNLLHKHQPEKVIIHSKQLKVVADWEIEEEISLKE